jgi:hypothetical protein
MEIASFTLDWLTRTFVLGRPISSTVAAYGQTNPLGVLRVHTEHGYFAIKQYGQPPRGTALAIEEGAYQAGFPMYDPLYALDGSPVAMCTNDDGQMIWILANNWIDGKPYAWQQQ